MESGPVRGADSRWSDALSWLAVVVGLYSAVLGLGMATQHISPVYFGDEWMWLHDVLTRGWWRGSICNHYGHPVVVPNLHLLANYHLLDGSSLARALVVAGTHLASALLVAHLAMRGLALSPLRRAAVLAAFSGFALWGTLGTKLWWSFGLTDGLALLGAVIAAYGVAGLLASPSGPAGTRYMALIMAGGALGTFSFGSGFAIWPAFAAVLLAAGAGLRRSLLLLATGLALVAVALFALPSCTSDTGAALASSSGVTGSMTSSITTSAATLGFLLAHAMVLSRELATPGLHGFWVALGLALMGIVCWLGVRVLLGRERDAAMIALTGLAAVPVGAALLVGLARSGEFGATTPYFPRYAVLAMPLWMLLAAMTLRALLRREPARALLASALVAALALGFLGSNLRSVKHASASGLSLAMKALNLAVEPEDVNSLTKGTFRHTSILLSSLPRLSRDRVGFWDEPIVAAARKLGQPAEPTAEATATCRGRLRAFAMAAGDKHDGLTGWVVAPNGESVAHVEAHVQGRMVGLGMHAGHAIGNAGALRDGAPAVTRALALLPGLAQAWGAMPGIVALARRPDGTTAGNAATYDWVCVLANGRRLRLALQ